MATAVVEEEAEKEIEGSGMGAERDWTEEEEAVGEVSEDTVPTSTRTEEQEEVSGTVLLHT